MEPREVSGFEALAAWLHPTVFDAVMALLKDRDAAMDVTHEAILALRKQPDVVRSKFAVRWAIVVARNRALDWLRAQRARPTTDATDFEAVPSKIAEPLAVLADRERRQFTLLLLEQLM